VVGPPDARGAACVRCAVAVSVARAFDASPSNYVAHAAEARRSISRAARHVARARAICRCRATRRRAVRGVQQVGEICFVCHDILYESVFNVLTPAWQ